MAANKFASMLHRKTNKMTVILIYAVLEWTLIGLLLLNSLLSYLIIKFANYFGLKPPCPSCSRIDHFIETTSKNNPHRDLLCEFHSTEISKLGYCGIHGRLAESRDMCEGCLCPYTKEKVFEKGEICSCCGVSLENEKVSPFCEIDHSMDVLEDTQKAVLIAEKIDDDLDEKEGGSELMSFQFQETGETEEKYSVSEFVKGETEEKEAKTLEEDPICAEIISQHLEFFVDYDHNKLVPFEMVDSPTEENRFVSKLEEDDQEYGDYQQAQASVGLLSDNPKSEDLIDVNGNTVELLFVEEETFSDKQHTDEMLFVSEELLYVNQKTEDLLSVYEATSMEELLSIKEKTKELQSRSENESKFAMLDSMVLEESEDSLVFHTKESGLDFQEDYMPLPTGTRLVDIDEVEEVEGSDEENGMAQSSDNPTIDIDEIKEVGDSNQECEMATETPTIDIDEVKEVVGSDGEESDMEVPSAHEEANQTNAETDADVSIGTEIPDLDSSDDIRAQDNFSMCSLTQEEACASLPDLHMNANANNGFEQDQEEGQIELKPMSVQENGHLNDTEEEKVPDTPTSLESLNPYHRKFQLLERKESGTEESLDGSMISEMEAGDPVTTAERLKSALRAERQALHALYAELEEERSASAVAANQTMAMINRLQEEKAAMQMEALQYQRMMEEQSEYDQEALQLLNELMVKREREKQELERELEEYRKKVSDYEAKEKMRIMRISKEGSMKSATNSASCSHSEDGDGVSIDSNQDAKEESQYLNSPLNESINLETSLDDFEEERISILEQLKVLEEKLLTLSDEEDQHYVDIRPIEDFYEENGVHLKEIYGSDEQEINGEENGFSHEGNGHYKERRIMGLKGKRLLPLFDATNTESEDGISNGHENGFHPIKLEAEKRFELEKKRIDMEEEVDQLYGRLNALEADKDFLKHCMSSMKKGDKGMYLLQEILQHLRDLRNVELRAKSFSDGTLL